MLCAKVDRLPPSIANLVNIQPFINRYVRGGLDLSNNLLMVLPPELISAFEAEEICWEKESGESLVASFNRDGLRNPYKLDFSRNPLR